MAESRTPTRVARRLAAAAVGLAAVSALALALLDDGPPEPAAATFGGGHGGGDAARADGAALSPAPTSPATAVATGSGAPASARSAAVESPPTPPLRGRVLDTAADAPVAGVRVAALHRGRVLAGTRTDAAGAFELAVTVPGGVGPTTLVDVVALEDDRTEDDGARYRERLRGSQLREPRPIELRLTVLHPLSGTVVDHWTGRGVPGLALRLTRGREALDVITDAAGRFVTPEVARPGRWTLAPERGGLCLSPNPTDATPIVTASLGLSSNPEESLRECRWIDAFDVELVPSRAGDASARFSLDYELSNPDGEPAPHTLEHATAPLAAAPRAWLRPPPGARWRIRASLQDGRLEGATEWLPVPAADAGRVPLPMVEIGTLALTPDGATRALLGGFALRARLLETGDEDAAARSVIAYANRFQRAAKRFDERWIEMPFDAPVHPTPDSLSLTTTENDLRDGRPALVLDRVPAGRRRVELSGAAVETRVVDVVVEPGVVVRVEVALAPPADAAPLRGTIANGACPGCGARVWLFVADEPDPTGWSFTDGERVPVEPGDGGALRFATRPLRPATYALTTRWTCRCERGDARRTLATPTEPAHLDAGGA